MQVLEFYINGKLHNQKSKNKKEMKRSNKVYVDTPFKNYLEEKKAIPEELRNFKIFFHAY